MGACEHYEELISALIDGVLDPADRPALMEHMAECPACQAYFDDQIAMHDAMDRSELQAPEGFSQAVLEQVRRTPQKRAASKAIPLYRWRRWGALAACCAVVALGIWGLQGQERSGDRPLPAGAARSYVEASEAEPAEQEALPGEEARDGAVYGQDAAMEPAAAPTLAALPEEKDAALFSSETTPQADLVRYEEAAELFGHALVPCTADDFEGYRLGTVGSGQEPVYAEYLFTGGWVRVVDQDRAGESAGRLPEDAGSVVYKGRTFLVEGASPEADTSVQYEPDGESGLSYRARFAPGTEQEDIFELLLSLEISE